MPPGSAKFPDPGVRVVSYVSEAYQVFMEEVVIQNLEKAYLIEN